MTTEDSNQASSHSDNTPSGTGTKGARVGRAAAWFTAGALGATAITGVAMAATSDADSGEDSQQSQIEGHGRPGGPGGPSGPGRHLGRPGGGPMLHGEGVIKGKDGNYQEVATQKGEVTKVGSTSVTIVSDDGYSAEYDVNDDTKVHKDREDASINDIATGDTVHVVARTANAVGEKDGDKQVAVMIGAMSPEQAAEMEERREEMRQRFKERREQRQNGDAAESGFWGGPPTSAPTT